MTNSSRLTSIICCSQYFKRPKDKSVKTEQDILTNQSNHSQTDITEVSELEQKKLYGSCKTCGRSLSDKAWCKTCEGQKLQKSFGDWTSGNQSIDEFIKNSQIKPHNKESYLLWIPFANLSHLKYMANGGFSAVYHALWDNVENNYLIDVVLKRLHNGCTSDPTFLNEQITMYLAAAVQRSPMIRCYGMTQHPTEGYMLVMEYADEGDLRNYISRQHLNLLWTDKVYIFRDIARALDFLHSHDFIHGDLHTGNVLKIYEKKSVLSLLTKKRNRKREVVLDLSLAYIPDMSTPLYGVMPYVAPEVFSKEYYTKASDIYSFGLIMWELAVGQTPFSEYAHDKDLVSDICKGVRPDIDRSIPQFYVDLMTNCWDADPEKRPSARVLRETIESWIMPSYKTICNRLPPESKDVVKQLKDADALAKKQLKRQAEMPMLLPPPLAPAASLFTSKSLKPFVTASEKNSKNSHSIRKVSSVVSSTSSLIPIS